MPRSLENLLFIVYGRHCFITMVTKTWFKTEVNLSIGLKPNLAFRLSFGLKLGSTGNLKSLIVTSADD